MIETKYEENVVPPEIVLADDISIYPYKLAPEKLTYGGFSRAEQKNLPIKMRVVKTYGRPYQFVFELTGDYHVEDLRYNKKPHKDWEHYGKIWLSLENAKRLVFFINKYISTFEEKPIVLDVKNKTSSVADIFNTKNMGENHGKV